MLIDNKFEELKKYLKNLGCAVIAFSSGIDSAFLLKTAKEVLSDKILAVTIDSLFFPEREIKDAVEFCNKEKIKHIVLPYNIFELQEIKNNPVNRCYLCKKAMFGEIVRIAKENNIMHILEGSNFDDDKDYRPGRLAVEELGIKSPLKDVGLNKEEIRILSKQMNLSSWNKPSFACLASRFVYGEEITENKLNMVDKAEQLLFNLSFRQLRVRIHQNIARIEVMPVDFENLILCRERIVSEFKKIGFDYVTMDLLGYRTGSMNEILKCT